MKRKSVTYLCFIFILSIVIASGLIYKNVYHDTKKAVSENIDNYLMENNYQQRIKKKEVVRDSKTGEYFAKVVFKDEPHTTYEIYQINSNKYNVYGYKDGVEITDKNEGKYITEY